MHACSYCLEDDRLQDPERLGAVLTGWLVLGAGGRKGEGGHGSKGDETGGHPWGDKITLYFLQITQLRTLSKIFSPPDNIRSTFLNI